jgi:hypothetical protein
MALARQKPRDRGAWEADDDLIAAVVTRYGGVDEGGEPGWFNPETGDAAVNS